MAAYQAERFIEMAIASVAEQSFPSRELIVVDDGSTDATPARLESCRALLDRAGVPFTIVTQDNAGLAAARNAAIDRAVGRYVAFLDADDIWHPRLLEALVSELDAKPGACLAFPLYAYVQHAGEDLGVQSPVPGAPITLGSLLVDNPIRSDSGVVIRASALETIGGFDRGLSGYVGLDYWMRAASAGLGALVCVPRCLVRYRRHDDQITADWRRMQTNWAALLDKARQIEPDTVAASEHEMWAAQFVYWSSLAYDSGDYPSARALILRAWRSAPRAVLSNHIGPVRTLSCLASLLPVRLHHAIRDTVRRRGSPTGSG